MDAPLPKATHEKLDYSDGNVSHDERSPAAEAASRVDAKKTLRQMDYRVIPIVTVLYLLSFLDRG